MLLLFLLINFIQSYSLQTNIFTISPFDNPTIADYNCNGTDDTIKVQEAICNLKNYSDYSDCINEPKNSYIPSNDDLGGVIKFLPGTYNLHQIILYSNIRLEGSGMLITKLKLKDNDEGYYRGNYTFGGFVRAYKHNNITISDLTLDGNKYNQLYDLDSPNYPRIKDQYSYGRFALFTKVCDDVFMDSVNVVRWNGYGIDPHGETGKYIHSNNFVAINSIFRDNEWDGIAIDKTSNVILTGNIIENNGRHGINIGTGSYNIIVDGNQIHNNGYFYYGKYDENRNNILGEGCGIKAQNNEGWGTSHIVVSDNIITNSNFSNICFNSIDNAVVSNNIAYGSEDFCMKFSSQVDQNIGVQNTIVTGNNCNDDKGIYFTGNCKYNIVKDNYFRTNGSSIYNEYAIYNREERSDDTTNIFYNNIFRGNAKYEIRWKNVEDDNTVMKWIFIITLSSFVIIPIIILTIRYGKKVRKLEFLINNNHIE